MKNPFVYVAGYNPAISCFVLDMESGTLKPSSTSDGGKSPTYLAWSPSRKFMYAVNEVGGGRVTAFAINPQDGALTRINDASSAGNGPCHVSVHPGGKWVFAANYGSGTIGVLAVKPDGGVEEPVEKLAPGKNAHQIFSDPSGKFVFVPCLGSNHVAHYVFDDATGKLTPNNPPTVPTAQGAGPRHLCFHPSGRFAYLINELDSTITSLAYDAGKGLLSAPETLPTLPAGVTVKSSTAHVLASPSGKFVYGSNRGHDSIVIFAVNPGTGRLTLAGHEQGGGDVKVPRDFTLDPTGKFLLSASQKGDTVTVFRCSADRGTLEKLSTVKVPSAPAFVGVMPVP
ncbi:MAG: lactonase family protein [Planctomycetota bacterium]|nr:lactonase family protein [Planctomycetota bacterium]